MYTQKEMNRRIHKLKGQIRRRHGFDLLVTHAPAYRLNDGEDLPHMGFEGFIDLMDKYAPEYFAHGHVHMSYGRQHIRLSSYKDTTVVNAFDHYVIDIPDRELPKRHKPNKVYTYGRKNANASLFKSRNMK